MADESVTKVTPTPGSYVAGKMGCTCPVVDNAHGRGACMDEHGKPQFWIAEDCPLHGAQVTEQEAAHD